MIEQELLTGGGDAVGSSGSSDHKIGRYAVKKRRAWHSPSQGQSVQIKWPPDRRTAEFEGFHPPSGGGSSPHPQQCRLVYLFIYLHILATTSPIGICSGYSCRGDDDNDESYYGRETEGIRYVEIQG